MLIKDYYSISSVTETGSGAQFCVSLNPDCEIYEGHFPSRPISPGACNINMITECAETLTGGSLSVKEIHRCRLTSLITPADPELRILISLSETGESATEQTAYKLKAEIISKETVCLTLDCTVAKNNSTQNV